MMKVLNDDDVIGRFIFERSKKRNNGRIKASAFKPRPGECLSTFEINELDNSLTCEHGRQHADNEEIKRHHIGFTRILHQAFKDEGLITTYDDDPPRHVSVEFPDDFEAVSLITKALASKCLLVSENAGVNQFVDCPYTDNT